MTTKPAQSERALQRQVAAYFAAVLDPVQVLYFHPMNEGKRGRWAQQDFKLGGGLAGVADWMLSWKANSFGWYPAVAWLELKSPTAPKKLPVAQEAFRQRVRRLGHYHAVCRDLDAVVAALHGWGVPTLEHTILPGGGLRYRPKVPA